jgi:hypothetical protein
VCRKSQAEFPFLISDKRQYLERPTTQYVHVWVNPFSFGSLIQLNSTQCVIPESTIDPGKSLSFVGAFPHWIKAGLAHFFRHTQMQGVAKLPIHSALLLFV